jgi:hypothetical protein
MLLGKLQDNISCFSIIEFPSVTIMALLVGFWLLPSVDRRNLDAFVHFRTVNPAPDFILCYFLGDGTGL